MGCGGSKGSSVAIQDSHRRANGDGHSKERSRQHRAAQKEEATRESTRKALAPPRETQRPRAQDPQPVPPVQRKLEPEPEPRSEPQPQPVQQTENSVSNNAAHEPESEAARPGSAPTTNPTASRPQSRPSSGPISRPTSLPKSRPSSGPTTRSTSTLNKAVGETSAELIERAQEDAARTGSGQNVRVEEEVRASSKTSVRAGSKTSVRAGSKTSVQAGSKTSVRAGSNTSVRAGSKTSVRAGSKTSVKAVEDEGRTGSRHSVRSQQLAPTQTLVNDLDKPDHSREDSGIANDDGVEEGLSPRGDPAGTSLSAYDGATQQSNAKRETPPPAYEAATNVWEQDSKDETSRAEPQVEVQKGAAEQEQTPRPPSVQEDAKHKDPVQEFIQPREAETAIDDSSKSNVVPENSQEGSEQKGEASQKADNEDSSKSEQPQNSENDAGVLRKDEPLAPGPADAQNNAAGFEFKTEGGESVQILDDVAN